MKAFTDGQHDVLLCTTIIESGVDNPRANTILIHRADRFGIADLYQLRGRVGRSSHKAYAYLVLPPHGHVDADARQRIGALRKHSGLSSGLHLAMKDLEIRGAGNLLGAAQSGHITNIGFGLYCQLLRRTVAGMKGEDLPPLIDTDLKIDFIDLSPAALDDATAACLPYSYIEEDAQRIAVYRRIAEATETSDLQRVELMLEDRYGRPPRSVKRLLRLSRLRIMAAERNISRIEIRKSKILLFRDGDPITHGSRLPTLGGHTPDEKLSALINVVKAQ
jgi:transcription-repair coupling factor (superfamily II helicase)